MELIAAVKTDDWCIGKDNELLHHIKKDLKFFKSITMGKTVIMGRKTWDSLPIKPLPGRTNIILTTNPNFKFEHKDVIITDLTNLKNMDLSNAIVIGGEQIYSMLLNLCDKAYITKIYTDKTGNKFIPNLDHSMDWKITNVSPIEEENGIKFYFLTYERI